MSFAACIVVIIIISIIVFTARLVRAHSLLQNVVSLVTVPWVSSPIYVGLQKRGAEILFSAASVLPQQTSSYTLLIVRLCACVSLCVHASVFHLTIHPGPGSICLSDHLM